MANRATEADVEAIYAGYIDSAVDIDSFIDTANVLVTEVLTGAGLSDDLLKEIEAYLAAHLVALSPPMRQLTQEKFGDATQAMGGKFGDLLKFSQFGQMVLVLDTSGRFQKSGKTNIILEAL